MSAYIILDIQELPEDPRNMIPYQQQVEETMALYGGGYRSLIRHRVQPLEGDWHPPHGVVVLEFPSYEQALAWYQSPEYAPLLKLRVANTRADTILVEGLALGEVVRVPGRFSQWEMDQLAKLETRENQPT
jgi:uncharacterized protein (DUF1330 family)